MRFAVGILCLLPLVGCSNSPRVSQVTRLPAAYSHAEVVVSPDARIGGVTADEIGFVRKALADQTRCQINGPVIAIGKDVDQGKEHLFAMTLNTMFEFARTQSGSWELASCGPYNY